MTTDKDPDFAGIARKMATELYPITGTMSVNRQGDQNIRRDVFSLCAEAKLRSDWETIRLLRNEQRLLEAQELTITDALKAHLSKLLEPFNP